METFRKIDWNRAWSEDAKMRKRGRDPEFWNRRAPSFAQHVQEDDNDDYVDTFLNAMNPRPEWSVLDVGCGPGTLACPLAKLVRRVTAVDFSSGMLEILKERKAAQGLDNLTVQLGRWEDDWQALGIERHDVAIASRSLGFDNPWEMLTKLMQFAGKRVYVSFAVGSGPFDPRVLNAVGREANSNPDYIYLYNLLYQQGIYANVALVEKKAQTFANEEEAVDSLRWMIQDATSSEEEALRRFVSAHLTPAAGKRWKVDGERSTQWAVLWWKVAEKQSRTPEAAGHF